MDLISDLGNDVAVAFLSERENSPGLDPRELRDLIARIRSALLPIAEDGFGRHSSKARIVETLPKTRN